MWKLDEIGIEGSYSIPKIPAIDLSQVSYYKERHLYTKKDQSRCKISFDDIIDHGSYGNVYLAKRDDIAILVKQPRMTEMNLLQEAVLQHLAYKTMESEGMAWTIPKVYDVFRKDKEVWFSMERIYGYSISDWFATTKTPDSDLLCLVAQLALILGTLEKHLNLDHRDLKSENLLIKKEACKLQLSYKDTVWMYHAPFSVVLLDFGFACLGSEVLRGKPWVNLGDGVLPPIDPCPKEGRDMFHLLVSLVGIPILQTRLSKRIHNMIDKWLSIGKKSYGPMARRWSTENWSYLVSSQYDFAIPNCCPLRILQELLSELKGSLSCLAKS
jgi:serine/threonine protein kinase